MIILGDGPMGLAIAAGLDDAGLGAHRVVGRPASGGHRHQLFAAADVVFDASRPTAVEGNIAGALEAGCRRFVIATTAWESRRASVDGALRETGGSAVAAPNFSLGVAMFLRLVDAAVALLGPIDAFDPYVIEWHRRSKADRPSGTAKELSRRVLAAHPRKRRLVDPVHDGPPAPDELELAVVRAGASPGMHLLGFDAPGESIELRVTARDRSAYAAGAIAAARWLLAAPRSPGIHAFDEVVGDLLPDPAVVAISA